MEVKVTIFPAVTSMALRPNVRIKFAIYGFLTIPNKKVGA